MSVVSKLSELPYRKLRIVAHVLKRKYATIPWPDSPSARVDTSAKELESRLRGWCFEGLVQSYSYKGQVLDLRRPHGTDDEDRALELHVRARPHPDSTGLQFIGHIELSRYEHKGGHINEDYFYWLSEDELRAVLNGSELDIEGGPVDDNW